MFGKKKDEGIFDASPKVTFLIGFLTALVISLIVGVILSLTVLRSSSSETADSETTNTKALANTNTINTNTQPTESRVGLSSISKYASQLGLDTDKFNKCLNSSEKANKVKADLTYGTEIGVQGTPATFVNGYLVSGALPFSEFKLIIDDLLAGKKPTSQYIEASDPVDVKISETDNIQGKSSAKVTMVEFSDFECPFCQRHVPTVMQILDSYKDQIRFVYKHFPLISIHPSAQKAAEASECAADQGKFWEMHDKLFGV